MADTIATATGAGAAGRGASFSPFRLTASETAAGVLAAATGAGGAGRGASAAAIWSLAFINSSAAAKKSSREIFFFFFSVRFVRLSFYSFFSISAFFCILCPLLLPFTTTVAVPAMSRRVRPRVDVVR